MWKCHKCGKPVYFAERKQSLGFDWHPECLRCQECGKRLNPGQHAEHKGVPYCHVPCYGALFGPQLFGHGSTVESHKSFGQPNTPKRIQEPKYQNLPKTDILEGKLKAYNQHFNNKGTEVRSREVNGRLILEGALRVYWGVQGVIHLKEDDDQRTVVTVRKRNSCRYPNTSEMSDEMKEPLLDPMATSVCLSENGFDVSQSDSTTCESCTWSEDNGAAAEANGKGNSDEDNGGSSTSQEVSPVHNQVNSVSSSTLPSKLDKKQLSVTDQWDELDDLLQVERKVDQNEKMYQTMPTPLSTSSSTSLLSSSSTVDNGVTSTEKTVTNLDFTPDSLNEKNESETNLLTITEDDSSATLKPEDFDDFKRRVQKEFFENANELRCSNDGTLKAGVSIDPSRINDSLKLYSENNAMSKSFSGGPNKSYEIEFEDALKQYETMHNVISMENDEQIKNARRARSNRPLGVGGIQKSESSSTCSHHPNGKVYNQSSSSSSSDTLVAGGPGHLSKSKSGPNCFQSMHRPRIIKHKNHKEDEEDDDEGDEEENNEGEDQEVGVSSTSTSSNYVTAGLDEDTDEATLRPPTTMKRNANYEPKSISIKMDCYDELEPSSSCVTTTTNSMSLETATQGSSSLYQRHQSMENNGGELEDGVVLRKPPKTGSNAIKRRSGNRRSRTKLKRRCSINGHFYNRETSFFTPPHGSMMSVWVTSQVDTREVINLVLEKYKVDNRAENFAVYIIRDNGEQTRVKEDDFPLVVRVLLGPHEDVARLFLVDTNFTPEISSEMAQFINLSLPECRSILDRYDAEQEREKEKIKEKYAELKRRIIQRMESLKVRL